jgi:hypothetical protein
MPRISTLRELLREEHGVDTVEVETSAQAGVAASTLMRQNGNRIGWVLSNLSAANMYLRPNRAPTATVGIPLAPGEWRSMIYHEDFSLPGLEWQIIASGAAADYYLLELILLGGERPAP